MKAANDRILGLDGLRAIAVMLVVWHHTHPGYGEVPISSKGFLGVDIFFVLSGFLITRLLILERASTGAVSLRNFYMRRALRIFPLYYLVLAVFTAYSLTIAWGAEQSHRFLRELPYHLTYTSNWIESSTLMAVTWSLSTEEQFYLVWPPLFVVLGALMAPFLLMLLLINQFINFQLANHALASVGLSYQELEILQCTFTPMILGVLGAIWSQKARSGVTLLVEKGGAIAVLAAVAMLVSVSVGSDIGGWPRLSFQLAALLLVLAVHFGQTSRVAALLEYRPLRYVGVVSYGIYLLHMFAADFSRRLLSILEVQNPETFFAVTMALSVLLAGASYRYFERPILALKSRFR